MDTTALAGYLTATLSVFDVTDGDVAVTLTYLDPSSGSSDLGTYGLGPSEQLSNNVPPGTYRIGFRVPATSASGPTCTIAVKDRGTVTFFVAAPTAIAVTRSGFKPAKATDLFVATSSLCKA